MAGWFKGYSYTCQTVDYSDTDLSRRVSEWINYFANYPWTIDSDEFFDD